MGIATRRGCVALAIALAFAAGCSGDDRTTTQSSATSSAGTGSASGTGTTSGGGATTECFPWPADGGGGGGGMGGAGETGGTAPCPEGTEVLGYLGTGNPCATYICLGRQGSECCYEIAPYPECPGNVFPSFVDCPTP